MPTGKSAYPADKISIWDENRDNLPRLCIIFNGIQAYCPLEAALQAGWLIIPIIYGAQSGWNPDCCKGGDGFSGIGGLFT